MEVVKKEIKPRKKKVVADAPVQVEQPNSYQDKLLELLAFKRNLDAFTEKYGVTLNVTDSLMQINAKLAFSEKAAKSKSTYDIRNMKSIDLLRFVEDRFRTEKNVVFLLAQVSTKEGGKVVFTDNFEIDKMVNIVYQNAANGRKHLKNVFDYVALNVGRSFERDALQAKENLLSDNAEIVEQLNSTMQGFADLPEQAKKSVLATYLVNQTKAND